MAFDLPPFFPLPLRSLGAADDCDVSEGVAEGAGVAVGGSINASEGAVLLTGVMAVDTVATVATVAAVVAAVVATKPAETARVTLGKASSPTTSTTSAMALSFNV